MGLEMEIHNVATVELDKHFHVVLIVVTCTWRPAG
jgi:hypothetical protein